MKLDLKNRTGSIILGSSHSLILGHKPDIITHQQFCQKLADERKSLLKLGFFDTSSPNYTTYYPDVTADDLKPKDGEFIFPVYRALSETIVSKYLPIDFSEKNVLKKSMSKLIGQTINVDHETAIGNAVGSVKDAFWQDSYETSDGKEIPAGINIVMMIDGKSNPRIARGIMMNPPSIHSNSVGIRFKWIPSHEFEEPYEFYDKVGTYDKDGILVRAIVQEIISYNETSLVPHGADVFAQKIGKDGKIVNPDYANSVYEFSSNDHKFDGTVHIDYKNLPDNIEVNFNKTIPPKHNTSEKVNTQNETKMKFTKEELNDLASKFKMDKGELTEENVVEKITKAFSDSEASVTQLKSDISDVKKSYDNLKDEGFAQLKKNAKYGEEALAETRLEAERLYKLSKGEEHDANIIKLIQSSNMETAKSLLNQYKGEAQSKFQSTCKSCGETVNLSSAIGSQEGLIDEEGNPIEIDDNGSNTKGNLSATLKKFRDRRKPSRVFKLGDKK